jgi:hypothetical protein
MISSRWLYRIPINSKKVEKGLLKCGMDTVVEGKESVAAKISIVTHLYAVTVHVACATPSQLHRAASDTSLQDSSEILHMRLNLRQQRSRSIT